jgi:protein kinase-like protein/AAA ATPase-like protein
MSSAPPSALPAPAGDALPVLPARFRAEKLLGRGAQRSVYLARDAELDRWVAVSVLDTSALSQTDLERLRQVHALAGSGAHPHVLPIDQFWEDAGRVFMISPFMAGGDLATRLESASGRPLPLTDSLRIGSHVCRALESVHASAITHCDVKPGNILLDENGDAHLADFGLAVSTAVGPQFGIVGTPAYIAPEQIASSTGGASADLYSLGCVLYELTTGRPPFVGEPASDVLVQHHAVQPVPPMERNPAIPRLLSDLILKLLEKQPSARPASAGDVGAALEGMLRSPGVSGPSESLSTAPDRQRSAPELPLVGRERELEALDQALSRVCDSSPGLVLLSGEAGSGKSRLAATFREHATALGCIVLSGTGDELRMASYRPLVEALAPLAGHLSELAPMHAELLRDFLYRGQGTHLDRLTPRGSQRDHLPAAVFALLSAVAKRRPLVLLLEDLHAVDISSLELVEGIASALLEGAAIGGGSALLVVVSTRPPVDERRRSLVAALRGEQACRSFELGPLEESAIFALLAELGAGRRPSGQLCRRVVKATDGNPLFVREAVHRLLDAGLFEARGASAEPWDVEFELPSGSGGSDRTAASCSRWALCSEPASIAQRWRACRIAARRSLRRPSPRRSRKACWSRMAWPMGSRIR